MMEWMFGEELGAVVEVHNNKLAAVQSAAQHSATFPFTTLGRTTVDATIQHLLQPLVRPVRLHSLTTRPVGSHLL